MSILRKTTFFCFSLLFIGSLINMCGCQHLRINKYNSNDIKQKVLKKKLWTVSGKLSCRYINQQWSSSFVWSEKHNYSEIRLIPFIASQQILITQTPHSAEILLKNKSIKTTNIDKLVFSELGWNIPFSKLKYWIRGIPAPEHIENIITTENHIQSINQDEWAIQYKNFHNYDTFVLPKKIFLKKGTLEIRIIINEWQ